MYKCPPLRLYLVCLMIVAAPLCQANETGEYVQINGVLTEDTYAAGERVNVTADITGDLVIAGGELDIRGIVSADVIAGGGEITLAGTVKDDARLAGGDITISAAVGDDLLVAGGSVRMTDDGDIGGRAWLAGGEVDVYGKVGRDLRVAAGLITIDARVDGDVMLEGSDINVLAGSRINGNLTYRSENEARIDPQASIAGIITRKPVRWEPDDYEGVGIAFPLTMIVAGVVWYLLFPGYTVAAAKGIGREPGKSFVLGLAMLIVIPVICFLFMLSFLGIWVGIAGLAVYFVALIVAYLETAFFLGDRAGSLINISLETRFRRLVSFAVAIILLGLCLQIPLLGAVISFLALSIGFGASILQVWRVGSWGAGSGSRS